MALAAQLELERDHALDRVVSAEDGMANPEDALNAEANREERASEALQSEFTFEALGSQANFDRVLYDGDEFGGYAEPGSDEEFDFIGLPGILEPDQVHELLTQRQARQTRRTPTHRQGDGDGAGHQPAPLYRTLKEQRTLLNSLVGLYAKNSGEPHGMVHAELRRLCGGPAVPQASVTQLQSRIDMLRKRLGHR
jgi:hypothetical protein